MSSAERRPGAGRYAQWERERRYLMPKVPEGVRGPREIDDLYLVGTTLRLRKVSTGESVVHKLTQKVRVSAGDPSAVRITNVYVTEAEFRTLCELGGAPITKTRWTWPGSPYVVDEFHDALDGLVFAEVELDDGATIAEPPGALADVTTDDRFSGGSLALMTPADLRAALAEVHGGSGHGRPDSVGPRPEPRGC